MADPIQKILDTKRYVVEFITSENDIEGSFFAYLLLPAHHLETFRQKLKTETLNLEEHGVILASGKGHEPAQEVKDHIRSLFPDASL